MSYSISPSSVSASESSGTISFTVSRSGTFPAETLFVSTTQTEGFSNNNDYNALLNQGLTFSSGQTSKTITITLKNDNVVEPNEKFGIIVQRNSSDPTNVFLAKSTFTITNDDVAPSPKPDLVINSLNVSASSIAAGGVETISYSIGNNGDASASATTTKFYISRDGTLSGDDALINTVNTPQLSAGASSSGSFTTTIPTSYSGSFTVIVVADANNGISNESSEANNSFGRSFTVTASPRPDLVINSLDVSAGTVAAGGSETISYSIGNAGSANAAATTTIFYLSRDGTLSNDDQLIKTVSTPQLAAGAANSGSFTTTIPTSYSGSYSVLVVSDANNSVTNESSEANNSFGRSFTVTAAPRPDLVINSLSVSAATISAGGTETISYAIGNNGNASAAATTTSFYLSTDGTFSGDDLLIKTVNTPQLAAGAASSSSFTTTIPTSYVGGYSVIIVADANGVANEGSEANNSFARSFTVTAAPKPDLVINSLTVSAATIAAGGAETISYAIGNNGNASAAATTTSFYLSRDGTLSGDDLLIKTMNTPQLAAGAANSGNFTTTIPTSYVGGYSVIIVADANGGANESSEANNSFARSFSVTAAPKPDLVINNLDVSATTIAAGGTQTISYNIGNAGAASAAATTTTFYLSQDGTLSGNDLLIKTINTPQLAAGASSNGNFTTTIPTSYTGSYSVIAVTDANNAVTNESSEINNSFARGFTVTARNGSSSASASQILDALGSVSFANPFDSVSIARITQGFGGSDSHGTGNIAPEYLHYAVDIVPTSLDAPIVAAAAGRVVGIRKDFGPGNSGPSGFGNLITVEYPSLGRDDPLTAVRESFYVTYAHLDGSKFPDFTDPRITPGEILGYIGNAGYPLHLHVQFGTDTITTGSSHDVIADASLGGNTARQPAVFQGAATDVLVGSARADIFYGGQGADTLIGKGGADTLSGGTGADRFVLERASDSTGSARDLLTDLDPLEDKIDLWFGVTGLDPLISSGRLREGQFDSDLATALAATPGGGAKLTADHAVVFTPTSGNLSNHVYLIVDANHQVGYQPGADVVIEITGVQHLSNLALDDFV